MATRETEIMSNQIMNEWVDPKNVRVDPNQNEWEDIDRDDGELEEAENESNEDKEERDKNKPRKQRLFGICEKFRIGKCTEGKDCWFIHNDKKETGREEDSEGEAGTKENNKDKGRKNKYPCGVCNSNVGRPAVECLGCKKWIHLKCSGMKQGDKYIREVYRCSECKPPTTPIKRRRGRPSGNENPNKMKKWKTMTKEINMFIRGKRKQRTDGTPEKTRDERSPEKKKLKEKEAIEEERPLNDKKKDDNKKVRRRKEEKQ